METLQWLVAAITAAFVAFVALLQWRTAQQKAVLDLFDRRFKVYETVKSCVDWVVINPQSLDSELRKEFLKAVNESYFFFGDDLHSYLEDLRKDIFLVRDATVLQASADKRMQAVIRINEFYQTGQPLFAKYMRFDQTVPPGIRQMAQRWWRRPIP